MALFPNVSTAVVMWKNLPLDLKCGDCQYFEYGKKTSRSNKNQTKTVMADNFISNQQLLGGSILKWPKYVIF